jgi:hypothetical protein
VRRPNELNRSRVQRPPPRRARKRPPARPRQAHAHAAAAPRRRLFLNFTPVVGSEKRKCLLGRNAEREGPQQKVELPDHIVPGAALELVLVNNLDAQHIVADKEAIQRRKRLVSDRVQAVLDVARKHFLRAADQLQ